MLKYFRCTSILELQRLSVFHICDYIYFSLSEPRAESLVPKPSPAASQQTKDDAYMQFMREMEGLL
jgi:hypothetical protein